MLKRILMLAVPLILILGFSFSVTTSAETNSKNNVEVIITNDDTGETKNIDPKEINKLNINELDTVNNNINESDIVNNVEGYEVFIPIESDESSSGITPFYENGSSKDEGGVNAKLFIDYSKKSNGQIRVNSVSGSWTPNDNIYKVSNRKVIAHNGGLPGTGLKKLSKTPTSNSFSYNTGWGFQNTPDGPDGPMAESTAKIKVSGMSGTSHTITVRTYTDY